MKPPGDPDETPVPRLLWAVIAAIILFWGLLGYGLYNAFKS